MIKTVRDAWQIPELRRKILFTIFALLIFRLGAAIPVPYINTSGLETYLSAQSGTILGLMNAMSGSAFSMATLFALSIQPYINSSIIIQLLTVAIPALERLAKEGGEEGRKKIASITRYTTVAIGHSGADYETSCAAIDAGAACCTHTFNAMGLFHQHRPGIMGAVLERPVCCEAICDGRHLHPGTVRLYLKAKGYDRVIAVTDSIMAAGLPDGNYKLGVNDVIVEDGDAKLPNGVRAGSTLTLAQALRNLMAFTGEGAETVSRLMTANPARLMGWSSKGRLDVGRDADLVLMDKDYQVVRTVVGGRTVYTR